MTAPGPTPSRRFPYGPLAEFVTARQGRQPNDVELGDITGTSRKHVYQWHRIGLTSRAADHAAVTLGVHPCNIWPDFCDEPDGEPT